MELIEHIFTICCLLVEIYITIHIIMILIYASPFIFLGASIFGMLLGGLRR
jgi:hypothetical protein